MKNPRVTRKDLHNENKRRVAGLVALLLIIALVIGILSPFFLGL